MQEAQRILADLSRHGRTASFSMPGDITLSPRDRVSLSGTGTSFDQTYEIAEIDRRIDLRAGFVQAVRLRNLPDGQGVRIPSRR